MNKNLMIGLVVAAIVTVVAIGIFAFTNSNKDEMASSTEASDAQMMNAGNSAPTFELMSLKGETVSVASLKGEKVYVKFWASWCSVCLAGMEELNTLAGESNGFKVYTIVSPGVNGEQDKASFIEWFSTLGYDNVEVLFDETGDVQKEYGIRAFPTSAYIGSDSVLVKVAPGHMSNEAIKTAFEGIN